MNKLRSILLTILCLGSIAAACCAEELRDPGLNSLLEEIKKDYGISLHYTEGPATEFINLTYSLAEAQDSQALKNSIILFVQEISLYPKDFFRNANCRDIYFVKKLFYKKKPVSGLFSTGTNYIFYEYSRIRNNAAKIRHNIHHELYHMIGSKHPFWKEHGPAWEALNREGFSYNPKYYSNERNPINFHAPPEPGFITDYAMASAEEDRAEVFACMMIPKELSLMERWAQKDKILFEKLELMRKFLKEAFYVMLSTFDKKTVTLVKTGAVTTAPSNGRLPSQL